MICISSICHFEYVNNFYQTQADLSIVEKALKKTDHELHDFKNKHELLLVEMQNYKKQAEETSLQVDFCIKKCFVILKISKVF